MAAPFGCQEDGSALRLLGHRYYDASTGRFLTREPIKDGRNWYAYGAGEANPLTGTDPAGTIFWKVVIVALIIYDAWEAGQEIGKDPTNPGNYITPIIGAIDPTPRNVGSKVVKRINPAKIRNEWDKVNEMPWPKDSEGKNYRVSHLLALADGGNNSLDNIEPKDGREHIEGHIRNGDFVRRGKRAK